jgi:hypothetical protein
MHKLTKYALALLMTAACGAAKDAAAEAPAPIASQFATATRVAPGADPLALPRVVPPRPSPPAPSEIVAVSAKAPKLAVDLLTAPTVPPAWLATPAKVAVIPSALPSQAPAKSSLPAPSVPAPKVVLKPVAAAPVRPAFALVPVVCAARPAVHPATAAAPPMRSWPPAYVVRPNVPNQETHGVAYFEPHAPAAVAAPTGNPR